MNDSQPREYTGRIAIYSENPLKCKVKIVYFDGDENACHFRMLPVGKVRLRTEDGFIFCTPQEARLPQELTFGGTSVLLTPDYVYITYIGNLKFSQEIITEFEAQEVLYQTQNP